MITIIQKTKVLSDRDSKILELFDSKQFRTSKEIAECLNIKDYTVRQVINKNDRNFGHFTPFGSKEDIIISEELDNFIIGSLLGDGSITKYEYNKSAVNKNSKLTINHSEVQKDYLLFKKEILSKLCTVTYAERFIVDKRDNFKNYIKCTLDTIQNKAFNKYRDDWYGTGEKHIPKTINSISPLSLAIWFQDDGSRAGNSGYYLATHSFNINDIVLLGTILYDQYGIITTGHKVTNNQHNMYINKESVNIVNRIIEPYYCESMKYKLIVR